jgi:hypothetical protein
VLFLVSDVKAPDQSGGVAPRWNAGATQRAEPAARV